ncbi:pyridoxal phosphate-dependent decarboxylase family protein, partial [Streptomyces broussonetiae]|uniref:pyridoxal phosphate-dependent decarboxylase family protein n=1 Tax=Streptomyces broussonetiae TaxID=2686304 RepID=UPI0035DC4E83
MADAPELLLSTPLGGSPSALAERVDVLDDLRRYLAAAWESFDRPRPSEPRADADLVARLRGALPESPGATRAALDDAVNILEASVSPSRPLFLAYVGSTGLETGVLASALSAAYDANLATAAGAADLLDEQAVRWVAEFVGYPAAEGHFTSGGQTSNFTALLAAREQALPGAREEGMAGRRGTVYCSDEAHHSVVRAVEAAGLGRRSLRRIPTDARRRMRADALREALVRDRAQGFTPVAVVATAGTTLTGAVDPIAAIADVCEREGVWLHVDGAYGVPAAATRTAAHLFTGLERADSVTVDAHKWLGVQK